MTKNWQLKHWSTSLSYLMGLIITDGTFCREYKTKRLRSVKVYNTTPEIIDQAASCFHELGFNPKIHTRMQKPNELVKNPRKPIIHLTIHHSIFALWVARVTQEKQCIPPDLFTASIQIKLAFISGIIDGDGAVAPKGAIRVKGSDGWIAQLPDFLKEAGIRSGKLNLCRVLKSGKSYYGVSVRRQDFVTQGGYCHHPIKQYRIEHGKINPSLIVPRPERLICPECGGKKDRHSDVCRACYLKSDRFHQHLRAIASAGNRAANIARWGTAHLENT